MENGLIHTVAKILVDKMNHYSGKEGLELQKLEFGMEILLINISKLVFIYLLAALLGVLGQTLIVHCSFVLVKRYSFGLHALNSTVCTVVSCCMFVITPLLLAGYGVGNNFVVVIFIVVIFILYCYAPADTKARPLIGSKLRKNLKLKAVISGAIVMIVALLVPSDSAKLLLSIGAAYQSVSILPLTYKILRRSEKNYEKYECV